jgi:signal transduction histidine kinase
VAGRHRVQPPRARPLRDVVDAARDHARRVDAARSGARQLGGRAMAVAFNEMTATLTTLNTELKTAKDRAEGASKAKDQFLANVSHELRTPLNGIMGMTTVVLDTPMSDEQREYMSIIDTSARGLLSIVNDVLDFAKIDADALTLEPAPFDPRACFEHTRALLWPLANARSLELLYDIDAALPAQLVGDETRLRQIVLNLAGNAIKFTPAGRVQVRVRVFDGPDSPNAGVVWAVEYRHRLGIPKDRQGAISTPSCRRYGSSTAATAALGWGSPSARLVAMMGGRFSVASEPGTESTFNSRCGWRESNQSAAGRVARRSPARRSARDRARASIELLLHSREQ